MRAGKKESIGVLIGAMAEAESKSFYDDTEAVTSDLKSLLNIFLIHAASFLLIVISFSPL